MEPAAKPASVGSRPCLLTIDGWLARSLWAWRPPVAAWISGDQTWAHRRAVWSCGSLLRQLADWVSLSIVGITKRLPSPRTSSFAADRPSNLAVFRDFVTTHDTCFAGQFPGRSIARPAHRTSPTNLGLYLLSTASAPTSGGGYRSTIERLERRCSTMGTLAGFRGLSIIGTIRLTCGRSIRIRFHVDSGNLAGTSSRSPTRCDSWSDLSPQRAQEA